jgi:hypothetical protein
MIKKVAHGSLSAAAQIRNTGARHVGKIGLAFYAALGRLYASHMEKAQMRLAPTRAARLEQVTVHHCQ